MKLLYVEVRCEVTIKVDEDANVDNVLNEMEMTSGNEYADVVSTKIRDSAITIDTFTDATI